MKDFIGMDLLQGTFDLYDTLEDEQIAEDLKDELSNEELKELAPKSNNTEQVQSEGQIDANGPGDDTYISPDDPMYEYKKAKQYEKEQLELRSYYEDNTDDNDEYEQTDTDDDTDEYFERLASGMSDEDDDDYGQTSSDDTDDYLNKLVSGMSDEDEDDYGQTDSDYDDEYYSSLIDTDEENYGEVNIDDGTVDTVQEVKPVRKSISLLNPEPLHTEEQEVKPVRKSISLLNPEPFHTEEQEDAVGEDEDDYGFDLDDLLDDDDTQDKDQYSTKVEDNTYKTGVVDHKVESVKALSPSPLMVQNDTEEAEEAEEADEDDYGFDLDDLLDDEEDSQLYAEEAEIKKVEVTSVIQDNSLDNTDDNTDDYDYGDLIDNEDDEDLSQYLEDDDLNQYVEKEEKVTEIVKHVESVDTSTKKEVNAAEENTDNTIRKSEYTYIKSTGSVEKEEGLYEKDHSENNESIDFLSKRERDLEEKLRLMELERQMLQQQLEIERLRSQLNAQKNQNNIQGDSLETHEKIGIELSKNQSNNSSVIDDSSNSNSTSGKVQTNSKGSGVVKQKPATTKSGKKLLTIEDFDKMDESTLIRYVESYMVRQGVKGQLIDKNLLMDKFGAANIKRLLKKNKLISFRGGITLAV